MAGTADPVMMSMSNDGRTSPCLGVLGKKQKKRLENILFKLKKPSTEEDCEDAPATPASPDPSSFGSEDVPASSDTAAADVNADANANNVVNRRSSRKPTRRERESKDEDPDFFPDGVNSNYHLVQVENPGAQDDDTALKEVYFEGKIPRRSSRIKVEKPMDPEWPGIDDDFSDLYSEQPEEDSPAPEVFSCDKCGDMFPTLHELDTHIDAAHIKREPKDFSVFPCKVCGKSFSNEAYLARHISTHGTLAFQSEEDIGSSYDPSIPFRKCDHCRKLFSNDDELQQHDCPKGPVRPYGCGRCGRSYSLISTLKNHLTLHEKGLMSDLECYYCGQKFMYSIELRRHINVHIKTDPSLVSGTSTSGLTATASTSGDPHADGDAQSSLKLKIPLSRFMQKKKVKKSGTPSIYTCEMCGKVFYKRSYLTMHMRVHGDKRFSCSYCGKSFTFKKSLEIHVRAHTGERPFQCSMCTKTFTRQDTLNKHERMHMGIKPFVCETCGRQFSNRFELQRHGMSHSQDKPFKCTICNKSYTDKKRLKEHMFTHSGDLPFVCDLCGKGFARKYRYNQHMQQHAGNVRYFCEYCNKGFYRRSDLNSHVQIHSDKRPHVCDVCGIGFLRESYLRRHKIIHAPEKPHNCHICGRGFARKTALSKHILTHDNKMGKMMPSYTDVRPTYHNYTGDFGLGYPGHVPPMGPIPGSNPDERDIMRDIQAVIGLGDDVAMFRQYR